MGEDVIGAVWRADKLVNSSGPQPVLLEQGRPGRGDERRFFLGDHRELVLRRVADDVLGLYSCSHLQGPDRGRPFQYLLDGEGDSLLW